MSEPDETKGAGQIAYEAAMAYFHWLPEHTSGYTSFEHGKQWHELSAIEQGLWLRAGAAVAQQVTGALL